MVTLATTRVLQPAPVSPKSARHAATPESTTAIAGGRSVPLQTSGRGCRADPGLVAGEAAVRRGQSNLRVRGDREDALLASELDDLGARQLGSHAVELENVRFRPFALPCLASVDSTTAFATEELFVPGLPWTMTEKSWSGCACASAMRLAGTMARLPEPTGRCLRLRRRERPEPRRAP